MFRNRRGSALGGTIFLGVVAAILVLVAFNRVAIIDWWWFRWYEPTHEVTSLATGGGMSEQGKHWLYRTGPQFVSQEALGAYCGSDDLGCISETGTVYILAYDQSSETSTNRATVTAAHEMLHMAWRRTSASERKRIEELLTQAQTKMQDAELNQRVAAYGDAEEQIDELHSMLGTEYEDIGDELEAYYRKYFSDRSKVVEASQNQPRL